MFDHSFMKATSKNSSGDSIQVNYYDISEDTLWACKAYQNLSRPSPKPLNNNLNVLSLFKPGEILDYVIRNSAKKETKDNI